MRSTSTIAISRDTRELLRILGRKGDTYDALIRQLVSKVKNSKDSLDDGFPSPKSNESHST